MSGPRTIGEIDRSLATAATRVLHEIERRQCDDLHRFSEGLVSSFMAHELLSRNRSWRGHLWNEVTPFRSENSKERIDFWIDGGGGRPSLAMELKIADPEFPHEIGRANLRGFVVSDMIKLATVLHWRALRLAYVCLIGRRDWLEGETGLCKLAGRHGSGRWEGRPSQLLGGKAERRAADLDEWMKPKHGAPKRLVVRRVERATLNDVGMWLWRVALPRKRSA